MDNDKLRTESAQKIFEAALKEFGEFGLAGARVDRIARKAGVNKAMIYYHFGSKEKLYRVIIDRHLKMMEDLVEENIKSFDDPEEVFRQFAQAYTEVFSRAQEFIPILLMEAISGGSEIKRALTEHRGFAPVEILKTAIEKGRKQGIFRDLNEKQTIISFVGMNLFYMMMFQVGNYILEIENEAEFRNSRAEAVADLILNGLRKRSG